MNSQYTCDLRSFDFITQEPVSFDKEDAFVILLDQQYEDITNSDFPPFYSFTDRLPPSSERMRQFYPNRLYDFYMRNGGTVNKGPCYLWDSVRRTFKTVSGAQRNNFSQFARKIVFMPREIQDTKCFKEFSGKKYPSCFFDKDGSIINELNEYVAYKEGGRLFQVKGPSSPYTVFVMYSLGGGYIGITSGSVKRLMENRNEKVWIAKPVFINTVAPSLWNNNVSSTYIPSIRVNGIRWEETASGAVHGQDSNALRIYCLQSYSEVSREGMVSIDTQKDMTYTAQDIIKSIPLQENETETDFGGVPDDDYDIQYKGYANGFIYDSENRVYVYDRNNRTYINY
jgi:hypothetical protein